MAGKTIFKNNLIGNNEQSFFYETVSLNLGELKSNLLKKWTVVSILGAFYLLLLER